MDGPASSHDGLDAWANKLVLLVFNLDTARLGFHNIQNLVYLSHRGKVGHVPLCIHIGAVVASSFYNACYRHRLTFTINGLNSKRDFTAAC
jgi:hypothetical protein